ncbi:hypothetical protein ACFWBX_20395 [Streptomyces sp. NPDC059991]|uniref:hypothetical protein n=1 Tax=Streptomyces sp. NPDC059991 TaxID=3347028 RepID=UPI0036C4F78B
MGKMRFWRWEKYRILLLTFLISGVTLAWFFGHLLDDLQRQAPEYQSQLLAFGRDASGALVIASVIALAIDPAIKKHFIKEIGPEYFWVSKGKDITKPFREAIEGFAAHAEYFRSSIWRIDFSWATDEQVRIDCEVEATGYSTDKDGYRFEPHFWLIPSAPQYTSVHRYLRFRVPGDALIVDLNESEIMELIEGSVTWDKISTQKTGLKDYRITYKKPFIYIKAATIYPNGNLFPCRTRFITERTIFELGGPALGDLLVSISHPNGSSADNLRLATQESKIIVEEQAVAFPGQVAVISWRRPAPAVENPDASEASTSGLLRKIYPFGKGSG